MNAITINTPPGTTLVIQDGLRSIELITGPAAPAANASPAVGHAKVFADGTYLPGTSERTDHVAVVDHRTNLMWAVQSLGDEDGDGMSQEDCINACSELRLLGRDDWRLPTRVELAALVDDTRRNPAIDTSLFPRVKPSWHWTSTALVDEQGKPSASAAWFVHFYSGVVSNNHRYYDGFALAVRRAGQ